MPWQLEREPVGVARLAVSADDTWLVNRLYGSQGEFEEHEDGSATLTTEYSNLAGLSQAVLLMNGRMRPIENTLLNDFADRLAAGDVTGARRLVAYGEEQLPRFRGSARDRVMRVALRGGRAGGRALAWLRQSWIRAAVVTHRFYN